MSTLDNPGQIPFDVIRDVATHPGSYSRSLTAVVLDTLLSKVDATRAEHHKDEGSIYCASLTCHYQDAQRVEWPCPTAKALGVTE